MLVGDPSKTHGAKLLLGWEVGWWHPQPTSEWLWSSFYVRFTPCPYRKLDPDVLIVQPTKHRLSFNTLRQQFIVLPQRITRFCVACKPDKICDRDSHSAEEKIRIVLDGLRGESSIPELCRREGIVESLYYAWPKGFLEVEYFFVLRAI
jgi:hypothetical protein